MLIVMLVIPTPERSLKINLIHPQIVDFNVGKLLECLGSRRVFDAHVQLQDVVEEFAWKLILLEEFLGIRVRIVKPHVSQHFSQRASLHSELVSSRYWDVPGWTRSVA